MTCLSFIEIVKKTLIVHVDAFTVESSFILIGEAMFSLKRNIRQSAYLGLFLFVLVRHFSACPLEK